MLFVVNIPPSHVVIFFVGKKEKHPIPKDPVYFFFHVAPRVSALSSISSIFLFLVLTYEKNKDLAEIEGVYDGLDDFGQVEPIPIVKGEEILEAELILEVERDVQRLDDGTIVVSTLLNGVSQIEDDLLLQDFVESIKFFKKVDFEFLEIVSLYNVVTFSQLNGSNTILL